MMLCGGFGSLLASHLTTFTIGAVSSFAIVVWVMAKNKKSRY